MGVNVVTLANGETIVDMTGANITSETVLAGYTGYGADGDPVIGTLVPTVHKALSVTLKVNRWVDNVQSVDVDFATADAVVIAGGAPGDREYLDCEVWCSGQADGLLEFSCTYEPVEDVIANIGLLTNGTLVITYATGSTIRLTDAGNRKLRGLTLYGKTTQNGTPSPDAPVELVSAGGGGSIGVTVGGKNLCNAFSQFGELQTDGSYLMPGTVDTVIFSPPAGYTGQLFVSFEARHSRENYMGVYLIAYYTDGTNQRITKAHTHTDFVRYDYTTTQDKQVEKIKFEWSDRQTQSFFRNVMVSFVSDGIYEPYKETQTLTVSTPNGLPGIPVTSGGNYTDENGQQWVCDEVDLGRGKYVRRVGVCNPTFSGVYTNDNGYKYAVASTPYPKINGRPGILSSSARVTYTSADRVDGVCYENAGNIVFVGSKEETISSIRSKYGSSVLMYVLAEPIETDLTAEQISAYAALHTNSPNTTITTDSGAGMLVRYVKE